LLQNSGDADFLQAVAESVLQILVEADVEGLHDGTLGGIVSRANLAHALAMALVKKTAHIANDRYASGRGFYSRLPLSRRRSGI